MRENDEITGLFRSRLAGAEMTVREGFWEKLSSIAFFAASLMKSGVLKSGSPTLKLITSIP